MPRRQPRSARIARVVARLFALLGACVPGIAYGTEMALVGLLTEAAAPALQAAAPSNDPALAGSELLNRSLTSASTQMQRRGPAWLERLHFDLSFDPAFQPRYALELTQPLLASSIATARSTCRAASSTTPRGRPAVISGSIIAAAGASRTSP